MGRELEGLELLTWDDLIAAGEYIEDVAVGVAETTGETIGFYGEKSMSAVYNFSQGRFDEALDDISQLYTSPVGEMQLVTAENNESVDLSDGKSVGKAIAPIVTSKLTKSKGNTGRSGKQARLKEMMNDPKVSSADRGWLKNDARHIKTGNKNNLRIPRNGRKSPGRKKVDKGYELAHPNDAPASSGQSYKGSKLKNHADHKVETKIHQHRYRNNE